ncbi:MAG TPA: glycosyltransferase family A protein [Methylomirabilota bacterium]|nr:glycosyltransferase family A protein [Methylomirabilota bacterium]
MSVVIPFYRARHLRDAIESVRAQTFTDYELVIVDDGSPDREEVNRLGLSQDALIRYMRQEKQGPAAARNTALRAARGQFIAFLDSDDTWEPTYLQEQIDGLTRDRGLDVIYCSALMMGQPETDRRALSESTPARELATCTSLLREEYTVFLSGVVARRDLILDAGLFDERFVHGEDFDLWTRMLKLGARMGFQPHVLLNRRLHSGSLSSDSLTHSQKALLVVEKFQARTDLTRDERAAVDWRIRSLYAEAGLERAKRAVAKGDFAEASRALKDANGFHRSWKLAAVRLMLRLWPSMIARVHDARERRRTTSSHATAERS